MQRKTLCFTIAAGFGLAGAIAFAANQGAIRLPAAAAGGAVVLPSADAQAWPASTPPAGIAAADAVPARATAVSDATVGDADSFGRNVKWLGLTNGFVQTSTDCATILAEDPGANCQQIADLAVPTSFSFQDIARIELPAKASNSLLCHWFSPRVTVYFGNPTGAPVPGRFTYNPTLTLENEVLDDPSLVDPTTGLPFNGKLTTSMSAGESVQLVVDPVYPVSQNLRDSAVCQDGLISKRSLVQTYGLTPAQANRFFNKATTVRMNISGSSRFVEFAYFSLGLRIVGD